MVEVSTTILVIYMKYKPNAHFIVNTFLVSINHYKPGDKQKV